MEMLVAGIAAILGLTGVTLALQSKALPSEADMKKAKDKLDQNPVDPDANTVVGKYLAFVQGDYSSAMPYLVHSADKTLKTLAEHELEPMDTAPQKVGLGDEWIVASKSFPALSKIFFDRAGQLYASAWPSLDSAWRERSREQGKKISAARPPGGVRRGLPSGWQAETGLAGAKPPMLDGAIARSGSYSIKLVPGDEKIQNSVSALKSDLIPISGKTVEISAFIRSDGTEGAADRLFAYFFDQNGAGIGTIQSFAPVDTPFWTFVSAKADVPSTAVRLQVGVSMASKKGNIWVDDLSVKMSGKEMLKNNSFEDR